MLTNPTSPGIPARCRVRRAIICLFLWNIGVTCALAATATLRGRIIDTGTGFGIDGAAVKLDAVPADGTPEYAATTDPFGFYEVPGVDTAGDYLVEASHPAYTSESAVEATLLADETRVRNFDLDRADPGAVIFDIYVTVGCVTTGIVLADVPVKVLRYATPGGGDTPIVRILPTDAEGSVVFRGMKAGYYRFEANSPATRPRWESFTTVGDPDDLKPLTKAHAANFLLKPIPQTLSFHVSGFDPVTEAVDHLEGFYVELTGLDPDDDTVEVVPPRTGVTDASGIVEFTGLPAIPWRAKTKRLGYDPAEEFVYPHAVTGDFPPPSPVELMPALVARSLFVFMTSPYFLEDDPMTPGVESVEFLYKEIPVMCEGIRGTNTEGITRLVAIEGTPGVDFQDGRTFDDLVPGRYRVTVRGQSPPSVSTGFVKPFFTGEIHVTLDDGLLHEGSLTTVKEFPVEVAPAVIRGRLFAADEVSEIKLESGTVREPLYLPKAQSGIEFIEFTSPAGTFDQILPAGSRVMAVDADADGEFTMHVVPTLYGIHIPSMTDYTGSRVRVRDVTPGMQTDTLQGWPFHEEWPFAAPSAPPANGTGVGGFPFFLESNHEYHIDLFVKKRVAEVTGHALADPDDPTRTMVLFHDAPSDTDIKVSYSDIGTLDASPIPGVGTAVLTPAGGGLGTVTPMTQGQTISGAVTSTRAEFRFTDVSPGAYEVDGVHARNTFDGPLGVAIPDWGAPGVLPVADPEPLGYPEPFTVFDAGDLQAFYTSSGSTMEWRKRTWDGMAYVPSGIDFDFLHEYARIDYAHGNMFTARPEIPVGGFDFWRKFGPMTYHDHFIASEGASELRLLFFGGPTPTVPVAGPPTPGYALTLAAVSTDDPTFHVSGTTVEIDGTPYLVPPPGFGVSPPATGSLLVTGVTNTMGWTYVTSRRTFVDPTVPHVKLTLFMKKGMMVTATVAEMGSGAPIENASVKLLTRFGGPIAGLLPVMGPPAGDYALSTAIDTAQVVFLEVAARGYKPVRLRLTPADAIDPMAAPLFIGVPVGLEPLPAPSITAATLNRFGLFLPGVNRSGGFSAFAEETFGHTEPLTCTWSATGAAAPVFPVMRPKFDTALGGASGDETIMVTDPISELWIMDKRSFPGNPHVGPGVPHLPGAVASPVVAHSWLNKIVDGTIPNVFHRRIPDSAATPLTAGGPFQIPDLPPGDFVPLFVAVTERGAVKVKTDFTYATPAHTLGGAAVPPWMAFATDIIGAVAAAQSTAAEIEEFVPIGKYVPLPDFTAMIKLDTDPGHTGFINYTYTMMVDWTEGQNSPSSGFLSFMPGIVGATFEAKAEFASMGFADAFSLGVGASIDAGTEPRPEIKAKLTPKSLEDADSVTLTVGVGAAAMSTAIATASEFELETMVAAELTSTATAEIPFPPTKLVKKVPVVGSVLKIVDVKLEAELTATAGVVATSNWKTEFPASRETSGADPDKHVNRRHFLGGAEGTGSLAAPTLTLDLSTGVALTASTAGGRLGARAGLELAGVEEGAPLTIETNSFGDWPPIKRVSGAISATFEAFVKAWIFEEEKKWRWNLIAFDHQFGTTAEFELIPIDISVTHGGIGDFDPSVFDGGTIQFLRDFHPLGSYRLSTGSREGLLFTEYDAGSGVMKIKVAGRSAPGVWAAPVEVGSADAVIAADLAELPTGEWMAVWSEVDAADFADLYPPTTIKYSKSHTGGGSWSAPATVAARADVALDLRLVVSSTHTGLIVRATDEGPSAESFSTDGYDWTGLTWGPVNMLFPKTEMSAFDASGSGPAGVAPARFAFTNADRDLEAWAWSGGASIGPMDELLTTTSTGDLDLFHDDSGAIFCLANTSAGALKIFANGGGGWAPITNSLKPGAITSLSGAWLADVTTPALLIAWSAAGEASPIHYAFLDPTGTTLSGPTNLTKNTSGSYSGVHIIPRAGVAASILAEFEINPVELREFEVSLAAGSGAGNDTDGDTVNDIGELLVVDADTIDAIETVADVLGTADFDGDGFSNAAEITAGTDPADPSSFPVPTGVISQSFDDDASEFGLDPASFTITRPPGDHSLPLTVFFTTSGDAVSGVDYMSIGTSVIIPAGEASEAIVVTPIEDASNDGDKTLTLTLAPDAAYTIATPDAASVDVVDRPFNNWLRDHFPGDLGNPAIAGPGADPEGDGLSNLLEYFVFLDPNEVYSTGLPFLVLLTDVISGELHLGLTYVENTSAVDVTATVQASIDLDLWEEGSAVLEEVSRIDNGDGTATVTVRVTTPMTAADRDYLRLSVSEE